MWWNTREIRCNSGSKDQKMRVCVEPADRWRCWSHVEITNWLLACTRLFFLSMEGSIHASWTMRALPCQAPPSKHLRHFVHDRIFPRMFGGSEVFCDSGIAEGHGSKIWAVASEGSMVSSSCFRAEHSTWGRQWWPSTVDNSWQLQPISTWSVL